MYLCIKNRYVLIHSFVVSSRIHMSLLLISQTSLASTILDMLPPKEPGSRHLH